MNTKEIIDISTWERKEHYEFFGNLPDPFFGLTAKIDFTECFKQAKADGASFFLYSLHHILTAVNAVPQLRCRIEDGSFGFAYFEWHEARSIFAAEATKEIERVKSSSGLGTNGNERRTDLIYFTSIPWVDFTGIRHAGGYRPGDSIPQIAVGKLTDHEGRKMMTVAIEANHGLADGRHIGQFFNLL
ncbi:CatA-like O-acetyltransferase [uncultured Duncaniella sp.]|uniref:CatA-like O-acetyltransferase n=1 Tax=uncultured Duncaniella sp. TaxID=2768039 RepID=UPI0025A9B10D|nr:CatA-like O-acetyltransferase [uncultured Duncaniella sp.]